MRPSTTRTSAPGSGRPAPHGAGIEALFVRRGDDLRARFGAAVGDDDRHLAPCGLLQQARRRCRAAHQHGAQVRGRPPVGKLLEQQRQHRRHQRHQRRAPAVRSTAATARRRSSAPAPPRGAPRGSASGSTGRRRARSASRAASSRRPASRGSPRSPAPTRAAPSASARRRAPRPVVPEVYRMTAASAGRVPAARSVGGDLRRALDRGDLRMQQQHRHARLEQRVERDDALEGVAAHERDRRGPA